MMFSHFDTVYERDRQMDERIFVEISDLLPVSVPDARVADDVEQGLVRLELLDLSSDAVGNVARCWLV